MYLLASLVSLVWGAIEIAGDVLIWAYRGCHIFYRKCELGLWKVYLWWRKRKQK